MSGYGEALLGFEFVEDGATRRNFEQIERARVHSAPPQARVYNDANIAVATGGAGAALTFNQERFDVGGCHSTSANTSRLTAPVSGLYLIGGSIRWAASAVGSRQVKIRFNGASDVAANYWQVDAAAAADVVDQTVTTLYRLTAGQYVELFAYQTSGGNLNVTATGNYSPEFWIVRLGSYA